MNAQLRMGKPTLALVAGVAALAALTVWGRAVSDNGSDAAPWLLWLDAAVAVVTVPLAALLPRRPVPTTVVLTVLAALSPAATPGATAGALLVARLRPLPAAITVAAAGVAAHLVQASWRPVEGISPRWLPVLAVAAYAALVGWGALARARAALLRSLADRARRAEAEQGRRVAEARMLERHRIAREMHDVLAHRLSLLATYAGALEYRPDAPPEQLSRAAGVVRSGVHQALDELREVVTVLREDGDDGRPQPRLDDLPRLVEETRDTGADVRFHQDVAAGAVPPPPTTGRTAYRIVQEGLTNARKHAAGRPVEVAVTGRPGDGLAIDITNPLPPGGTAPAAPGTGTGLVGLTERVHLASGRLDHTAAGGRFALHAWLPWPA